MADAHDHIPDLVHLPTELHIAITTYLADNPRDVFQLLKTCRALHSRFTSHAIWRVILKAVCRRDVLYLPSYPLDSISVWQLQRAAMAPDLWNARLRRGEGLANASMQTLANPREENQGRALSRDYNRVYFVPGGRYLIEQARGLVTLWDLGLPSLLRKPDEKAADPRVVDSIPVALRDGEDVGRVEFVAHPSPDGKRLRVWVVPEIRWEGEGTTASCTSEVWEIDPLGAASEGGPKFEKLGSLKLIMPGTIHLLWGDLSMRGDEAIFHSTFYVTVWNYVENKCLGWALGSYANPNSIMFISQGSAILVKQHGVFVWTIPRGETSKEPRQPSQKPLFLNLLDKSVVKNPPPTFELQYPSRYFPGLRPLGRTLSHWYNENDSFPALYDVVQVLKDKQVGRWVVDLPSSNAASPHEKHGEQGAISKTPGIRRVQTFNLPHLNPDTYCLHRVSHDLLFTLHSRRNHSVGADDSFDLDLVFTRFPEVYPPIGAPTNDGSESDGPLPAAGPYSSGDAANNGSQPPAANAGARGGGGGIVGMKLNEGFGNFCSFTFCSASGRVAYSVVDVDANGEEMGGAPAWMNMRGRGTVRVFDFWDGVLGG